MMDKVSAKPGNLVTVTRMDAPNLAFVVGWRDSVAERRNYPTYDRFVMLRFIKPAHAVKAGVLYYDTRDLEVIS
jgi:hypothetical protein